MTKEQEQELLEKHKGLVLAQIKTFAVNSRVSRQDYIQAGLMGLLKAIRKFDPTKSQLQTFAWPIIRNELINTYNKAWRNMEPTIEVEPTYSISTNILDELPKLTDIEMLVIKYKLEGYTIKEIAGYTDITQKDIKSILNNIYIKIKADNE